MVKVNPNNKNKTKSAIFLLEIFQSNIIFHWSQKKLKYCKDFHNRNLSILLQKGAKVSK